MPQTPPPLPFAQRVFRIVVALTVLLFLAGVSLLIVFQTGTIPTTSMEPTLPLASVVLWLRASFAGPVQRGDVVAFRYPVDPTQTFVKRITGLPGDRIQIRHKALFLNGVKLEERYVEHSSGFEDTYRDNFPSQPRISLDARAVTMLRDNVRDGEVIVPSGVYFVLGDNRDSSLDSRYWGFVPEQNLLGRLLLDGHGGRLVWLSRAN